MAESQEETKVAVPEKDLLGYGFAAQALASVSRRIECRSILLGPSWAPAFAGLWMESWDPDTTRQEHSCQPDSLPDSVREWLADTCTFRRKGDCVNGPIVTEAHEDAEVSG